MVAGGRMFFKEYPQPKPQEQHRTAQSEHVSSSAYGSRGADGGAVDGLVLRRGSPRGSGRETRTQQLAPDSAEVHRLVLDAVASVAAARTVAAVIIKAGRKKILLTEQASHKTFIHYH